MRLQHYIAATCLPSSTAPPPPTGMERSLLYTICQLPVRTFTEVAIATAISCWNWLLVARSDLEYPVSPSLPSLPPFFPPSLPSKYFFSFS